VTVSTLRCDRCGLPVTGLEEPVAGAFPDPGPRPGVRFSYHPGDVSLRDDSGLLCRPCWRAWTSPLGQPITQACAVCATALARTDSLFLRRSGAERSWQLCARHAAEVLNGLLTVEPKLDPATFRLPRQAR
jgi:hypothetical protein